MPEHEVEQWRDEEDKKREVQGEEQIMELEPGKHVQEGKAYFVRKSSSRMKLEHKRWRKEF